MLLKAADVCNEARPWSISEPWAKALFAEHAEQVALEQQHGLPVTAWMQNDTLPKQAKSQLGFIDFVLLPLVAVMRKSAPPLETRAIFELAWAPASQGMGGSHNAKDLY